MRNSSSKSFGYFFLIVTPIGLIQKMFHKDLLSLKFNNNKTYWIKKDKII